MKLLFLSCLSIAGHKSSHSLLLFVLFYWLTWVDVLAVLVCFSHLKHRNTRLSFKYTCFLPRRQEGSFQDVSLLSSTFDDKMTNFYFLYPQNLVLVILIRHLGDKDWIFSSALWMLLCWVLMQIPAARTKCLWKVKRSAWEIWFIQIGSGFILEVQTSKLILLVYSTLCLLITSNHNFTQLCTLFWISDVIAETQVMTLFWGFLTFDFYPSYHWLLRCAAKLRGQWELFQGSVFTFLVYNITFLVLIHLG